MQLEDKIKEKVDEEYKSQVSLSRERDVFLVFVRSTDIHMADSFYLSLITTAIQSLVRQVSASLNGALLTMTKLPWSSMQVVGDQSEYITSIGSTLSVHVSLIRKTVTNGKQFKWFCDKFVEYVAPAQMNHLSSFTLAPLSPVS